MRAQRASKPRTAPASDLREVFAGRRGRLLIALLLGELGAAVTGIAYSTVLPVASAELDGGALYGATLVAAGFATLLVLAVGPGPLGRLGPRAALVAATALFVGGVAVSAAAPSMWLVLVGMVVRGLAAGVLAGFELTAVGALYDDRLRARVVGLFAIVWLVPSLLGPVANSVLTLAFSWRLAMAWPVLLVVASRVLIGRDADLVPWGRQRSRPDPVPALVLLGALVAAACAPAVGGSGGMALLAVGVLIAAAATVRVLVTRLGDDRARLRVMLVFPLLCFCFFGGHQLAPLAVIDGLGAGVATAAATVGTAQVAWSLLGLRGTGRLPVNPRLLGLWLLAVGLAAVGVVLLEDLSGGALVVAWTIGGAGMGLAYRELFSDGLSGLPPDRVASAAVGLTFAELAATTIGALAVGGWYSHGHVDGVAPRVSLGWAYVCLAAVSVLTTRWLRCERSRWLRCERQRASKPRHWLGG